MNKEKKNGALAATIVGAIVFIVVYIITNRINVNNAQAAAKAAAMGQQYVPSPLVTGSNGVLSQIQVLASVIMVLLDRKRGFITALILECASGMMTLIGQIIIAKNIAAIPGIAITLVSIIILIIIYLNGERLQKMHAEIVSNNEQLIEQNRMIEEKDQTLTYLAYYDRMTGLPNRAFFSDKIQEYIDSTTPFAIIYMDADNFKQINDNFGHQTGDELIKTYADRFQKYCGDKYTCAKVGGDEFAMILEGRFTEADIMNIVEQLRTLFGEPVTLAAGQFSITMSYGICGFPNDGSSPDALITAADTALYNAKLGGKNRPCFFSQHSLG